MDIKHAGGMEIAIEYEDAALDVAVPGEWSNGLYYLRDFRSLYPSANRPTILSEEERVLVLRPNAGSAESDEAALELRSARVAFAAAAIAETL